MRVIHSVAQFQKEHVALEPERIDRTYLNAYLPESAREGDIAAIPPRLTQNAHFTVLPRGGAASPAARSSPVAPPETPRSTSVPGTEVLRGVSR